MRFLVIAYYSRLAGNNMELTWQYLATTTGAIAVTVLIANALRQAFGWSAPWVALSVAFVLQSGVWWFVGGGTAEAAAIAVVNTFVIYAGATGGNNIVNAALNRRGPWRHSDSAPARGSIASPWWRPWY